MHYEHFRRIEHDLRYTFVIEGAESAKDQVTPSGPKGNAWEKMTANELLFWNLDVVGGWHVGWSTESKCTSTISLRRL